MEKLLCQVNGNPATRLVVMHNDGMFSLPSRYAVAKSLPYNVFRDLSEIESLLDVTLEVLEEVS